MNAPRETVTSPAPPRQDLPAAATASRGHPGLVVTASLATGFVAALLLAPAPFVPATQSALTGAILCGFALGWLALFLLSRRFTDRPQQWAAVPGLFMGIGGLLLLLFGSPMRAALSWVWPPLLLALVVWMAVRVHRDLPSRFGRIQLYVVFALLAIFALGGGWQTVGAATEEPSVATPGRMVDVGGYRLFLHCAGSGSPTVVLQPGGGGMAADMAWIAPEVARRTRVCVYDRAGRGRSETAPSPQDGAQVAADLHTLLHRAGVPGPYVLAGHSFGGQYVRIFAAHYPDEVAGLVLVDSTAAQEPARSVVPSSAHHDGIRRAATFASLLAPVGVARMYAAIVGGTLPTRAEDEVTTETTQSSTIRSVAEEYLRAGDTARETASFTTFGDKPLVVLTAGVGNAPGWMTAQNKTVGLSTNSVHRVVAGARHADLVEEEQYAATTARAVLDVVSAVRTGQPLRQ